MSTADTFVRARIDTLTKNRATEALEAMGLTISDAIRLLLLRIADERCLPFEVRVPNATTRKALVEAEDIIKNRRARFNTPEGLFHDLEKASKQ